MKTKFIMPFCFLILLIFSGILTAQDMKPEAGKLYNEGNQFLKQGNYDKAVDSYNKSLAIEKDYRTYYQIGIAYKYLSKLDDAENSLQAALKLKPDFYLAYNALGGIYYAQGKFDKAVESFEKVVNSNAANNVKEAVKKNLAFAYTKMGNAALNDGNSKKAIDDLQNAVKNNNYDAAYLTLAKIYTDLSKWDEAIDAAQNALKFRTSISKGGPYYYMGLAYKGKGDTAKAKDMFAQAKSDGTYKKSAEYELKLMQ